LALLPLFLVLGVAEVVSRIVCWRRFSPVHSGVRIQGDSRWRDHPTLLWSNRPFYLEHDGSAQYDEFGQRVKPGNVLLPPKKPGELRVLCLGGSVMAGVGSSQQGDWLKITGISTHPIEDSIDGLLEAILQQALPGTEVSVYNAAVASFAIDQSRLQYQLLRDEVDPDWVVSLDGVNEPRPLATSESAWQRLEERWRRHPVKQWKFRAARLLMRNSASLYLLGEQLFFRSGIIRSARNSKQDPEVLRRWLKAADERKTAATASPVGPGLQKAADGFIDSLGSFHRQLTDDGQNHVLLVQPHLSLRDPGLLGDTERALLEYYWHENEGQIDAFMREIHRRIEGEFRQNPSVFSLSNLHRDSGWVFLDYCHLTREANLRIATDLARTILASEYGPSEGVGADPRLPMENYR
jgi:hypothetical protein